MAHLYKGICEDNLFESLILTTCDNHQTLDNEATVSSEGVKEDNTTANNEAEYMETDSYYDDDHINTIVDELLEVCRDLNLHKNTYDYTTHMTAGEILKENNYNKLDEGELESSSNDISRASDALSEKYKVSYANQGIQASPCTAEKMCQTYLEFDKQDRCKRCQQFDEKEPNKRTKVSHNTNMTNELADGIRMETSPTHSKITNKEGLNIANNEETQLKKEKLDSLSLIINELEVFLSDQIVPTPNSPSPQIDWESKKE